MSYKKLKITSVLALTAFTFLQSSCSPLPLAAIIDSSQTKKLAAPVPSPSKPVNASVTCDVSWGGKPAPIANGYFKKRIINSLSTIPGFLVTKDSESTLKIHVSRNNKWDSKSMSQKTRKVVNKESSGEAVVNNYDHYFTISGNGKQWSGNVPHTIYMVIGDVTSTGVQGLIFSGTNETSGGTLNTMELVQGDEAMLKQVIIYALYQARKAGCYN